VRNKKKTSVGGHLGINSSMNKFKDTTLVA
jgi:hypothetical protein